MPNNQYPKPYSSSSVLYHLLFWLSQNPLNLFIVLLGLQFLSSVQAQTSMPSVAPRGRRLLSRAKEATASPYLLLDKDVSSDSALALSPSDTAFSTLAYQPGRMLQAGPQGTEFQVNTNTTSDQGQPSITALANGGFAVTWQSYGQDGSSYGVYGQMYNADGSKKDTEFQVNTYTAAEQFYSSTAALTTGGLVVTWISNGQNGASQSVYGQIYNADGSKKATEFLVSTFDADDKWLSTAALTNGGFVVAWQTLVQYNPSLYTYYYDVYGQMYNADGSKKATKFQVNTYTTLYQWQPSITALANGGFLAAWSSKGQDGSGYGVYGQMYDVDGSKIATEFQVNTYTTDNQVHPLIAALSNGGFVVTWSSNGQDGSGYGVYGQMYNVDGSRKATEFQVNTYTNNDQFNPSIAALTSGGFVVTWVSYNQVGSQDEIYGQIYNADGTKNGSEFLVNTYTPYDQAYQSTASLTDGGFVVTWQSYSQDSSGWGVFGQRFDYNGNKINIMPLPTPSASITPSYSNTPSQTASASNTASCSASQTRSASQTPSSSLSSSASASQTASQSQSSSQTQTASRSASVSASYSSSPSSSNRIPVIQLILNQVAKVALPFMLSIDKTIAFDPEGNAIRYNLIQKTSVNLPVWLSFNASSLQLWGTPYNSDLGAYTMALEANDSLSVASSEFTLTVMPSVSFINLPAAVPYKPGTAIALFADSNFSSEVSQTLRIRITLSDIAAGNFASILLTDGTSAYNPSTGVWSMSGPSASVSTTLKALSFIPTAGYDQDFSLSAELSDGINLPISRTINFNLSKTADSSKAIIAGAGASGAIVIAMIALYLYYSNKLAKARSISSPLAYQVQTLLKLGYWTYTSTEGREFAQGIKAIENSLRSKDIELKFEPKDKLAKTADIIAREIRNKRPGLKSALCFSTALAHPDLSVYAYSMAHVIQTQLFKHHARHLPQETNPMRKVPSSISITNPSSVKPVI